MTNLNQPTSPDSPQEGEPEYDLSDLGALIQENPEAAIQLVAKLYRGPTAPPEVLAEYERLCPGSAKRYLDMLPDENEHRRAMEIRESRNQLIETLAPLGFGFAYSVVFGLIGAAFMYAGHPGWGSGIITGVVVSGIFAFVHRARQRPSADNEGR